MKQISTEERGKYEKVRVTREALCSNVHCDSGVASDSSVRSETRTEDRMSRATLLLRRPIVHHCSVASEQVFVEIRFDNCDGKPSHDRNAEGPKVFLLTSLRLQFLSHMIPRIILGVDNHHQGRMRTVWKLLFCGSGILSCKTHILQHSWS